MKAEEGKIDVDGHQVWYHRIGDGGIPLLTLHGGPSAAHDYLESLEGLATARVVIFYDQLGCGRSDQPDDRSLWRIERFVAVGRYDELTPVCAETLHRGILNSRMVVFEESAHMAHLEEPGKYRQAIAGFLANNETSKQ